jgi:ABC-type sugar transport system permease subunit
MKRSDTRKRIVTKQQREARRAYAIIIPIFTYITIWSLIPLLIGLFLGFTKFDILNGFPEWVGLDNFKTFFGSKDYPILLFRQLWMGGLCLITNTILSFVLALGLNVKHPLRGFFRTSVYVPTIAAASVTSAVFLALLNPFNGGLNKFLVSMGFEAVVWSYSQFWMVFWVVVFYVWRSVGPSAIIWLGGLQSIDTTLYEAAKVDGANKLQQIKYITIPGLRFIAIYIVLTGLIGAMQMYDVIMLLTHGNPYGKTDVLMYRIYRDGVISFNMGMAGAASTILGLVTIFFAFISYKSIMRGENQ